MTKREAFKHLCDGKAIAYNEFQVGQHLINGPHLIIEEGTIISRSLYRRSNSLGGVALEVEHISVSGWDEDGWYVYDPDKDVVRQTESEKQFKKINKRIDKVFKRLCAIEYAIEEATKNKKFKCTW